MEIRKTCPADLDKVLAIYRRAREFMRAAGNPTQWGESWPPAALVADDIRQQKSYVCVAEGRIVAVFFLECARDPTYEKIYGGAWLEDERPYAVVHRIASSGEVCGAGAFCLEWALEQWGNIRIDTHEANAPMRHLLEKLDYHFCGTIHTHDGTPRLAFQKLRAEL